MRRSNPIAPRRPTISGALAGLLPVRRLVPEIRSERKEDARSPITWGIVVIGCTSPIMLWKHSRRTAAPVVDAAILSRPDFARPSAIYWLHMLSFSGVVYSLAFFINSRPGGTAAQFGFVTLFLYGSGLLSAPLAGRLIDRFEPRTISILALTGSLAGALPFVGIKVDTPRWAVIAITCVLGFSMGTNTPSIMMMAFSAVPPRKMGAGTGLFRMFRDLGSPTGSSLSLAVFGATLAQRTHTSLRHHRASAGLDPQTIDALTQFARSRDLALPTDPGTRVAAHRVDAQSLIHQASRDGLDTALTNVGYLLTTMIGFALLLALRLRSQPPQRGAAQRLTDPDPSQPESRSGSPTGRRMAHATGKIRTEIRAFPPTHPTGPQARPHREAHSRAPVPRGLSKPAGAHPARLRRL